MTIFHFIHDFFKKLKKEETVNIDYNKHHANVALKYHGTVPKKVLVVGCNTGLDCSYFVDAGSVEVHGVDVVDGIGRDFNGEKYFYHQISVEDMQCFEDESFDMTYCFATMEHVPNIEAAYSEMVRVTKNKGTIYCVAAPLWNSRYGHHKGNYFKDYPWIHLLLNRDEIIEWTKNHMAEIGLSNETEIVHHIDYMLNIDFFNKRKASEYVAACSKLPVSVMRNELSCEGKAVLTPEANKILIPMHGKEELLAVVHTFVAKK